MSTSIDQLNKLTDEEVRVRVARALGLNVVDVPFIPARVKQDYVFTNAAHEHMLKVYPMGRFSRIPPYDSDLNAMHEAEKTLKEGQLTKYFIELYDVCDGASVMATARQRAIAFLSVTEREEG